VQDAVPDTSCTHNRKEIAMKGFAVRLLSMFITASLVWLPIVVHAGLSFNALD